MCSVGVSLAAAYRILRCRIAAPVEATLKMRSCSGTSPTLAMSALCFRFILPRAYLTALIATSAGATHVKLWHHVHYGALDWIAQTTAMLLRPPGSGLNTR